MRKVVVFRTRLQLPQRRKAEFGKAVKGREKRFPHVLGTKFFLRLSAFINMNENV